jgi:hypothetical protein
MIEIKKLGRIRLYCDEKHYRHIYAEYRIQDNERSLFLCRPHLKELHRKIGKVIKGGK